MFCEDSGFVDEGAVMVGHDEQEVFQLSENSGLANAEDLIVSSPFGFNYS